MIVDVPRMTGVKKKACLPMNSRNPVHDGGMTIPHTMWCRKMLRILPNYGQTPFHGNGCFPQSFRYQSTKASFDYQRLQWFSMLVCYGKMVIYSLYSHESHGDFLWSARAKNLTVCWDRKGRKASLGLPPVTHTDLEFLKHENVYSI